MPRIITSECIEANVAEDALSVRIDPICVIESVFDTTEVPELNKIFGNSISSVREYVDDHKYSYFVLNPYLFEIIPNGYDIVVWEVDDEVYVAIHHGGKLRIYKVNTREMADVVFVLTRFFVFCGDTGNVYEFINSSYDYYDIVDTDGRILSSGDPRYEEIMEEIFGCEEIAISHIASL